MENTFLPIIGRNSVTNEKTELKMKRYNYNG